MVAKCLLSLTALAALTWFEAAAVAAPYDATLAELGRLVAANSDLVSLTDIGVNDQGVAIQGIRIEGPGALSLDRPQHLVVGAHHGNEQMSVDVALRFASRLIQTLRDPSSPQYAALAQSTYIVVPVLNISGFNAGRREESASAGGTLDPNRDYPDPCTTDRPFVLASTRNLAEFIRREDIVAAVTVHGYIGTFTYPWGIFTTNTATPDHRLFQSMSAQVVTVNGYETGTHADAIYPTAGAFEDWAYHELGVWVMLLEIANRPNVDRDADALLKYFAVAPRARSTNHDHLGDCTFVPDNIIARP